MASNLNIYQGDDYSGVVTVTDAEGAPANLTGYTAKAQIRRDHADNSIVVYEIPTVVSTGQVTLTIPSNVTELLSGRYRWDLELTSGTAVKCTVIRGWVQVTPEVTRLAS